MNLRYVLIFLSISLCVIGCGDTSRLNKDEIEAKWISLYKKGGCLIGGQHWGPGTSEGSIFREKEWKRFFKLSSNQTIPFLMARIDSTIETNVHVCPFHMASEGELAIYASEHILKKNWYESDNSYIELAMWSEKRKKAVSPVERLMLDDLKAISELSSVFGVLYLINHVKRMH